MKKSRILLAALAAVLVLTLSVGSALAYFYASARMTGTAALAPLDTTTVIEEPEVSNGRKLAVIKNTGDGDVFVRARAYAPDDCVFGDCGGDGWVDGGDGWFYYEPVLENKNAAPKNETKPLQIIWSARTVGEPADAYNVVVVYEAIPALYKDGDPIPVADRDWSVKPITETADTAEGGDQG